MDNKTDKEIVYCRNRQVYLAYDAGLPIDLNRIHDGGRIPYKNREESDMPSNDMAIILRDVGYDICVGNGGVVAVKFDNKTVRVYNLSSFEENIDYAIDYCLATYICNTTFGDNERIIDYVISESYFTNEHKYTLNPIDKNSIFENGMHCGYNEGFMCGFTAVLCDYHTTTKRKNYVFCPNNDEDVLNNGKYLGFMEGYQFGTEYGRSQKYRVKGSVDSDLNRLIGGMCGRRRHWL